MGKKNNNENPVLKKKYKEGYDDGMKEGIARSTSFFAHKFDGLKEVEGIGPKTFERIKEQLGEKYFKG